MFCVVLGRGHVRLRLVERPRVICMQSGFLSSQLLTDTSDLGVLFVTVGLSDLSHRPVVRIKWGDFCEVSITVTVTLSLEKNGTQGESSLENLSPALTVSLGIALSQLAINLLEKGNGGLGCSLS